MSILQILQVQHFANLCFSNNTLVGFDMQNDLTSLAINVDKRDDLAQYFVDKNGQKYSLKDLCRHFFKDESFQCGIHSAIQDARKTRDLYFKKLELQAEYPDFRRYPEPIERSKKLPYKFDRDDVCRCESKKKRGAANRKGNQYYLYD